MKEKKFLLNQICTLERKDIKRMNSSKVFNDDIRKTVQHNKKKKSNKLPIIIILLIIIIAGIIIAVNALKDRNIELQEVTEYNYFITQYAPQKT